MAHGKDGDSKDEDWYMHALHEGLHYRFMLLQGGMLLVYDMVTSCCCNLDCYLYDMVNEDMTFFYYGCDLSNGSAVVQVLILAFVARTLGGAGQLVAEALAILSNASIILASATHAHFLDTCTKGIGTFLERRVNGMLSISIGIVRCIETTNTGTNSLLANFAILKA